MTWRGGVSIWISGATVLLGAEEAAGMLSGLAGSGAGVRVAVSLDLTGLGAG